MAALGYGHQSNKLQFIGNDAGSRDGLFYFTKMARLSADSLFRNAYSFTAIGK